MLLTVITLSIIHNTQREWHNSKSIERVVEFGNILIACLNIFNFTLRNVLNYWLLIFYKYMEF